MLEQQAVDCDSGIKDITCGGCFWSSGVMACDVTCASLMLASLSDHWLLLVTVVYLGCSYSCLCTWAVPTHAVLGLFLLMAYADVMPLVSLSSP